jgi:hypothetical protein
MQEHFLVVRPFTDSYGEAHKVGEQIIPGDTATPSMLIEIARQVQNGNLKRMPSGEGVAKPSDKMAPKEEDDAP